ncbi:coiled-coil domain-containing protein 57 isoform X2 [Acipenser oxyrinchus oxyrinchus]|uniref:Coiled-coil domain-containing protein 57 isoform X2 n=1 Tax=Acipenser oxyrinchus oxyrinchus TaxID=40147 RepID=A0AAD8D4B8_ACIOX|nr:coiled-coil domain-containing protein 57 isoform X2 [Acipenser oxyrinchus oxyrinchus]
MGEKERGAIHGASMQELAMVTRILQQPEYILCIKQAIGSKEENTPPELSQSPQLIRPEHSQLYPETRPLSSQSQPLMSSFGADSSLQDIWQMLDSCSSPSVCTPREGTEQGAVAW